MSDAATLPDAQAAPDDARDTGAADALPVVIFDLDGTLVDSAPDMHAAMVRVLAARGHPPLTLEQVRGFIGNGARVLIDRVIAEIAADPAEADAFTGEYLAAYQAGLVIDTAEYAGVTDALQVLTGAGHKMGICTNKPQALAEGLLEGMGLGHFFQVVIGGDTDFGRKPDAAPLIEVIRLLGGVPAVMVGDSAADAGAARAAKVPILLYTGGYREQSVAQIAPDAAFDDWADLPGLIARLTNPA